MLTVFSLLWGCAAPKTQRVKVDDALVALEAKKQREIALKTQIGYQKRLMRVSYPILESSAPLCEDDISKNTLTETPLPYGKIAG